MFATSHVLAGGILGGLLAPRRPALAFAIGIASHAAMDITPHWGKVTNEEFMAAAKRDGVLLTGAGLALAALAGRSAPGVTAGAFGALLPDLNKPCQYFFGQSPFPDVVDRFHGRIQCEQPTKRRLRIELAAGVGLALVAFPYAYRIGRRR